MNKLILIGKLSRDYDGNVSIIEKDKNYDEALSVVIGDFIEKNSNNTSSIYDKEVGNGMGYRINTSKNNVQLRYYVSDKKINSLEGIKDKYLKKILGSIDISVENIGYSEYTITGYETENFKIGNRNLEKIFSEYIEKYICIIININEEDNHE